MEFSIGQVVISKAGRDKGGAFIVLGIDGDFLHLVDGLGRPLENPKKKKIKHVQPTNTVVKDMQSAILGKLYLKDADFRQALKDFIGKREDVSHG